MDLVLNLVAYRVFTHLKSICLSGGRRERRGGGKGSRRSRANKVGHAFPTHSLKPSVNDRWIKRL